MFSVKEEPAPKNRKNPHQTGLFLIPLADAQVNPEPLHSPCFGRLHVEPAPDLSSVEMHGSLRPVARREAGIRARVCGPNL
jgi:hypothetical protein